MNEIFIWASTKISNCGFLASTNIIGPDITLKVMAGDSIQISGEVLYTPDPSGASSQVIPNLVQTFINAFSGLPPVLPGEGSTVLNEASTGSGIVNAILNMQQSSSDPNSPNAFVNYVLFDENMNLVPGGSGAIQISSVNTSWQNLPVQKIAIPQNGFLRAFSSNTSTADIRINNFQVTHMQGVLQEEYNYYPYGLIFDQSHALTVTIIPTNYLYNGKELQQNEFGDGGNGLELYDYGARMYDVQIGRWCGVDPMAIKYSLLSPYAYVTDNPTLYVDPDGKVIAIATKQEQQQMLIVLTKEFGAQGANFCFDENNQLSFHGDINAFTPAEAEVYAGLESIMNQGVITTITFVRTKETDDNGGEATGTVGDNPKLNGNTIIVDPIEVKLNQIGINFEPEYVDIHFGKTTSLASAKKDADGNPISAGSHIETPRMQGDSKAARVFHGIGHVMYQKNSQQENVIKYENKARANFKQQKKDGSFKPKAEKEREVDTKHKNKPD
jgi:RHS repeat-associated protein